MATLVIDIRFVKTWGIFLSKNVFVKCLHFNYWNIEARRHFWALVMTGPPLAPPCPPSHPSDFCPQLLSAIVCKYFQFFSEILRTDIFSSLSTPVAKLGSKISETVDKINCKPMFCCCCCCCCCCWRERWRQAKQRQIRYAAEGDTQLAGDEA